MGIRRRRKKINTILTTIDRRLRSVELQRVPRVVKDGTITKKMLDKEVQISLDSGADASTDTPGITTPQPPTFRTKPFTNIVKIVYRGYNEVGTDKDRDRARVYFESDPGLNVGDKIKFAAVTGSLDVPTKTTEYTVQEIGIVEGYHTVVYFPGRATIVDGAKTYDKGWRIQAANVSVTGAIVEGATTKYKYGQIIVYSKDTEPSTNSDFLNGPTWPTGIETTSGVHFTGGGFALGSLINIEGLGTLFDGTHKVTYFEKVGTKLTIQFEFKSYPTAPVQLPNSNGAIRGAAGRYLRDGETWTDTSVDPAVTWIWDDQRQLWWNAATTELPEGVITDDGVPPAAPTNLSGSSEGYVVGNKPFSRVNLSWTAPTTNSDGTNLSDLKGYAVYYRYTTADSWTFYSDVASASETVSELTPEKTVYFSVKAYDVTRNMSAFSQSYSVSTVPGTTGINAPSAPVSTSRLGQIRVTWNGLDSAGATPPLDLISHVEVHWSTTSGFTPSDSTNKGRLLSKNDFFSDIDPAYGIPYYFKFVFVDIFNKKSVASAQTTATVTPLVDTDLVANTLTRWPFGEDTINVASLADGSIAATYLTGQNDAQGNPVRVEGKIAAGSIGAVSIAANAIVAGKIAADAITAREISALSITTGKLAANAVTADKIEAGTITSDKINATTRIRLGDSNTTTPTNYIEFGYTTLPGSNVNAPGIIGQYAGTKTFYLGGWNSGQQTSGLALGVISGSGYSDVLSASGYDNGLGMASYVDLQGGAVGVNSSGGNFSDPSLGDLYITTSGYGTIYLTPSSNVPSSGAPPVVQIRRLRVEAGSDVSLTSVGHGFQIGDGSGNNLRIDTNEVQAVNNGSASALYLNNSGGSVFVPTAYSTSQTGRAMVVNADGRLGYTSSTIRSKQQVVSADLDYDSILSVEPKSFKFNEDVERLGDEASTFVGFIAEDLHEAGLTKFVYYSPDGEVDGIDYASYVVALQTVAKVHAQKIIELENKISVLESK